MLESEAVPEYRPLSTCHPAERSNFSFSWLVVFFSQRVSGEVCVRAFVPHHDLVFHRCDLKIGRLHFW